MAQDLLYSDPSTSRVSCVLAVSGIISPATRSHHSTAAGMAWRIIEAVLGQESGTTKSQNFKDGRLKRTGSIEIEIEIEANRSHPSDPIPSFYSLVTIIVDEYHEEDADDEDFQIENVICTRSARICCTQQQQQQKKKHHDDAQVLIVIVILVILLSTRRRRRTATETTTAAATAATPTTIQSMAASLSSFGCESRICS